jgi:hypothetical protein
VEILRSGGNSQPIAHCEISQMNDGVCAYKPPIKQKVTDKEQNQEEGLKFQHINKIKKK